MTVRGTLRAVNTPCKASVRKVGIISGKKLQSFEKIDDAKNKVCGKKRVSEKISYFINVQKRSD